MDDIVLERSNSLTVTQRSEAAKVLVKYFNMDMSKLRGAQLGMTLQQKALALLLLLLPFKERKGMKQDMGYVWEGGAHRCTRLKS